MVPPFTGPEPAPIKGFPPAPQNTAHQWLVSWHWPSDPDEARSRMFDTRAAAEGFRDRLERTVHRDPGEPDGAFHDVIVRIDVRDVLPWREVG